MSSSSSVTGMGGIATGFSVQRSCSFKPQSRAGGIKARVPIVTIVDGTIASIVRSQKMTVTLSPPQVVVLGKDRRSKV
jgi:hypothetical protein